MLVRFDRIGHSAPLGEGLGFFAIPQESLADMDNRVKPIEQRERIDLYVGDFQPRLVIGAGPIP